MTKQITCPKCEGSNDLKQIARRAAMSDWFFYRDGVWLTLAAIMIAARFIIPLM